MHVEKISVKAEQGCLTQLKKLILSIILYDNCCDAIMKYCENSYIYTNDKALNTRCMGNL